jgi:hypothetical protein
VKSLESPFSQRKSKIFIPQFTFEPKVTSQDQRTGTSQDKRTETSQNKRIETSSIGPFFPLIVNTSKLPKEREIERSSENSSVTERRTSTTQNVTSIETIESIPPVQVETKTPAKKTKMRGSSIKSF